MVALAPHDGAVVTGKLDVQRSCVCGNLRVRPWMADVQFALLHLTARSAVHLRPPPWSKGMWQMPHTSSPAAHVHAATPCHRLILTFHVPIKAFSSAATGRRRSGEQGRSQQQQVASLASLVDLTARVLGTTEGYLPPAI